MTGTSGARFAGRVALVTGGGSGIGASVASLLAAGGATVGIADIDAGRAATAAGVIHEAGGSAVPLVVDVTVRREVFEAVEQLRLKSGAPSIVVHCAASPPADDILAMSDEQWHRDIDISLTGAFHVLRATLPHMLNGTGGVVVTVASVNAFGFYGGEAYSAGKAGLVNLTRSVALRYGKKGIRANAVAPGAVKTPMWERDLERDGTIYDKVLAWYPAARLGEPDDVAQAIAFLASDAASWINGTVLVVDGGFLAGNQGMWSEMTRG